MNKSDQTLFITGCTPGGIGYACAHVAKAAGYRVLATARKRADTARLKAEGFEAFCLDLDDSNTIDAAVAWVKEVTGGKLYALFNNAAYGQPGAVEDLSRETLRAQFETNLFGTHELTVKLLPLLLAHGSARIVQNSSMLGYAAMRYRGAYNASKYALEALSDTLRMELADTDVKVVLIEPGPIHSRFRQNALRKFLEHIDIKSARLAPVYEKKLEALKSERDIPYTLGPEAVAKVLLKALNDPNPKIRYRVTLPAHFFYGAKRLFSDRMFDRLMRWVE